MYILPHNELSFTYTKYSFMLIDNLLCQGSSISYIDNNCNRTTIFTPMLVTSHAILKYNDTISILIRKG